MLCFGMCVFVAVDETLRVFFGSVAGIPLCVCICVCSSAVIGSPLNLFCLFAVTLWKKT